MRKEHAEHNEMACDFLLTSQKYNDWVVTTAFYSALHFVQNEIFPFTERGVTYSNINQYKARSRSRLSKHELTIELVKTHIPAALINYRWLYDACMSARYHQYVTSPSKADTAKNRLRTIKAVLTK